MEWTAARSGWLQEKQALTAATLLAGALGRRGRRWLPRWVVLYSAPTASLGVYEQRSDASPPYAPLRRIDIAGMDGEHMAPERPAGETPPTEAKGVMAFIKRTASNAHVGLRRAPSTASVASTATGPGAVGEEDAKRIVVRGTDGKKITLMASSPAEREEWAAAIRAVCSIAPSAIATAAPQVSAPPAVDAEAIVCGGVVVIDGASASRLRSAERAHDRVTERDGDDAAALLGDHPLRRRGHGRAPSAESADSIVAGLSSSSSITPEAARALAEEAELREIARLYVSTVLSLQRLSTTDAQLGAVACPPSSPVATEASQRAQDTAKTALRLEMTLRRAVGRLVDIASARVARAVDALLASDKPPADSGALELRFVAPGGVLSAQHEDAANAHVRRELAAANWLHRALSTHSPACQAPPVVQPLRVVLEYRGYRALAVLDVCAGGAPPGRVLEGSALEDGVLRPIASALGLPPLSFHGPDGAPQSLPADVEALAHGPFVSVCNVHGLVPVLDEDSGDRTVLRPSVLSDAAKASSRAPFGTVLADARRSVFDERLPALAAALDALAIVPVSSACWRVALHSAGVNVSSLGRLYAAVRLPHAKAGLAVEMVARAAKTVVRSRLRGAVAHLRSVRALRGATELRALAATTVNTLFAVRPDGAVVVSAALVSAVAERYGCDLATPGSNADGWTLLPAPATRVAVLSAVAQHCGLRVRPSAYGAAECASLAPLVAPEDVLGSRVLIVGASVPLGPGDAAESSDGNVSAARALLGLGAVAWHDADARAIAASSLVREALAFASQSANAHAARLAEVAAGLCPAWHARRADVLVALAELVLLWRCMPDCGVFGIDRSCASVGGVFQPVGFVNAVREVLGSVCDTALGEAHPKAALAKLSLADVLVRAARSTDTSAFGAASAELRSEAFVALSRAAGRRHAASVSAHIAQADALSTFDAAAARAVYAEVLRVADTGVDAASDVANGLVLRAMLGQARCAEAVGETEDALMWTERARARASSLCAPVADYDDASALAAVLRLAQRVFVEAALGRSTGHPSELLVDAAWSAEASALAAHLSTALDAAVALWVLVDSSRNTLVRSPSARSLCSPSVGACHTNATRPRNIPATRTALAARIVALALRLATPTQQPALRAALRRHAAAAAAVVPETALARVLALYAADESQCGPLDRARMVLRAGEDVATLADAESSIAVLLDLVHASP